MQKCFYTHRETHCPECVRKEHFFVNECTSNSKSFPGSDSKIPDRASIVTGLIKIFPII